MVKYFCRWVSEHPTLHVIEAVEHFDVRPKIGMQRKTDRRTYTLVYTRPEHEKTWAVSP